MLNRSGMNNSIALEKLEILYGDRGDPKKHALRKGDIIDIQSTIKDFKSALESIRSSLKQVKTDIDEINGQIFGIDKRLDDAESAISGIEEGLGQLLVRINNAELSVVNLENEITNISSSIGVIGGDVTQIQTDISHLQSDLQALTTRVTDDENDIAELQIDINNIDSDISTLQQAVLTLSQSLQALTSDVNDLKNGSASLTVTPDLNNAVRNKAFTWDSTSSNTPVAGSSGRGLTIATSSGALTQIGIVNGNGQVFVRYLTGGAWSVWADIVTIHAEPYAVRNNPGTTSFPPNVFTAIPFMTSVEMSGGITCPDNKTFTVPIAGLYQFEIEVRANGGLMNMPVVGTPLAVSLDTTTVPTTARPGYCVSDAVRAMTIMRLVCTERLAAGAQRVAYLYHSGMAAYQFTNATIKITRLSA